MNLLLDTHILLWALTEDPRLTEKAKELILDEANVIYYSSVSIWEVAVKHSIHPDNVEMSGKELAQYLTGTAIKQWIKTVCCFLLARHRRFPMAESH